MVYKYRATRYEVPAQGAGEYLEELGEKQGGLTAKGLLEASRPEDALLHKCFTWDDRAAAEKYRLNQARVFISNIVAVEIKDEPVEPIRAFVSVTENAHRETGIFKPIVMALSDEKDREIVLKNAIRDAEIFKEKYCKLEEMSGVIAAIDEALRRNA